jgi:hypothetical protein
MKIICIDNFDRETVSDVLVAENLNQFYGKLILDFLINNHTSSSGSNYYILVEDNYKLHTFEP